MKFEARNNMYEKCLNKFKRDALIVQLYFLPFSTILILSNFHRTHNIAFAIFYIIIMFLLYIRVILKTTRRGFFLLNSLVETIEISDSQIIIKTFTSAFYFNLFKYNSIIISADRSKCGLTLSDIKYGFDKAQEFTKQVYVLNYGTCEFLLAENFFNEFEKIKSLMSDYV